MANHLGKLWAIIAAVCVCIGCQPEDKPLEAPAPTSASVEFKGKVDPSLAATWKSLDGRSTMALNADGTASMQSNVPTPQGSKAVSEKAKWLVDGDALLIQKSANDTIRYYFTKQGSDKLEVRPLKNSKIKVLYSKAKAK